MLLLLTGLLSIKREKQRFVPWFILAGAVLTLFSPARSLKQNVGFAQALVGWISWSIAIISGVLASSLIWQVRGLIHRDRRAVEASPIELVKGDVRSL